MSTRETVSTALLIVLAVALAYGAGVGLRVITGLEPAPAAADPLPEEAEAQEAMPLVALPDRYFANGEERGRVLIGEMVVLEVQSAAGGLTGYERCMVIAKRLNDAITAGVGPNQVVHVVVSGMHVVTIGGKTLITATPEEARRQGVNESQLADGWAAAVAQALGGEAPPPLVSSPTEPQPAVAGPGLEPSKDKLVPILSVLQGIRIGVARVSGPASAVDRVKAVAQLETDFRRALSISVYVPIDTDSLGEDLGRVQGVGLTGLADLDVG